MDLYIQIGILVLGVCGFFVAKHIRDHKVKAKPLVCMIGFDCHTVVHSDYSKFFGIPVEFLGMFYYVLVSIIYLFFILNGHFLTEIVSMVAIAASCAAFLFSTYLIGVQIFILKKGCSWCIVSAFICLLIFILTAFNYHLTFITDLFQ